MGVHNCHMVGDNLTGLYQKVLSNTLYSPTNKRNLSADASILFERQFEVYTLNNPWDCLALHPTFSPEKLNQEFKTDGWITHGFSVANVRTLITRLVSDLDGNSGVLKGNCLELAYAWFKVNENRLDVKVHSAVLDLARLPYFIPFMVSIQYSVLTALQKILAQNNSSRILVLGAFTHYMAVNTINGVDEDYFRTWTVPPFAKDFWQRKEEEQGFQKIQKYYRPWLEKLFKFTYNRVDGLNGLPLPEPPVKLVLHNGRLVFEDKDGQRGQDAPWPGEQDGGPGTGCEIRPILGNPCGIRASED